MAFRSLSPATKEALVQCQPYGYKDPGLTSRREIIKFWRSRNRHITAFLNLKELTPDMIREIREHILESNDTS